MPLIQSQVVERYGWLSLSEFTDLITISQMTPGPIAVNSATFVGLKIAGFGGALVATFGCILPSCIIVSALAYLYLKYRKLDMLQGILNSLRPAVVAMIATAGVTIILSSFYGDAPSSYALSGVNVHAVIIFVISLFLLRFKKMNPITVMVLAGALEVVFSGVGALL